MKHIAMLVGITLFATLPAWLAAQSDQSSPPPPPDQQYQAPQPPDRPYEDSRPPRPAYPSRDHGEIGAFADYMRFVPAKTTTNFVGVGGRVGINVHPNVAIEADMSYDFARNFTSSVTNGGTTTFVTTGVRPLSGLFGPKLRFGTSSPFRAFLTGKVGFIDFSTTTSGAVSGSTFANSVAGVGGPGTHLALYPGGGIEMFAGFLGLRVDAGDEVYLNSGTYNNLKVSAGPVLRF